MQSVSAAGSGFTVSVARQFHLVLEYMVSALAPGSSPDDVVITCLQGVLKITGLHTVRCQPS